MGCGGVAGVLARGLVPDAAVAVPDLHLFPGCQPEDRVRVFRRTGRLVNGFPMFRVPPAHLLSPKTTQPQLTRTIPRRQTIPLIPSHKSSGNSLADDLHDNNRSSNQDNNGSQSIPFAVDLRIRPAGAASFTRRSGRLARRPYGLWSWELPFIQHQTLRWDIVAKSFCASLGRRLQRGPI